MIQTLILPEELIVNVLEYTDEFTIRHFNEVYPKLIQRNINFLMVRLKLKYPFLKYKTDYNIDSYDKFKNIWDMSHYYDKLGFAPFIVFFTIDKKNNLYKLIDNDKIEKSIKFHSSNNLKPFQVDYMLELVDKIDSGENYIEIYNQSFYCYLKAYNFTNNVM